MARPKLMTRDSAETIALEVLAFIAAADSALDRLMTLSGLDRDTLRRRANDPELHIALLDFILSDEQLLVEFCETSSYEPSAIHVAHHVLGQP
ncbi:MAG: DUF3572 domain-containing protein [Proteobacteria bacterium]|nr:DUF3572 domain-containing protein [Pseudomonadota bacterium]